MSKLCPTSSDSDLVALFDQLSTLHSLVCKQNDGAGDVICSRKRGHSSQTSTESDLFAVLLTTATALNAITAHNKDPVNTKFNGVVNGAVSLMLSCIKQLMESNSAIITDALPSLFASVFGIITINSVVEQFFSRLKLTFLLRLLSCMGKDSSCIQLPFLRQLCTTLHTNLSTMQSSPLEGSLTHGYFISGEMTSTEMRISFELSLRRILLSRLRQPQSTASSKNSIVGWLVGFMRFEHDTIDFLSLAEDDEKLFDFLNISLQLEHRMKFNLSLFNSEMLSALENANSRYFVFLLTDVFKLDLSTLLDLLCGEETCSLEYLLRFLKSHFLLELDLTIASLLVTKQAEGVMTNGNSRLGVLVLCEEQIIKTDTSNEHASIAHSQKGKIRPAAEEWQPKDGQQDTVDEQSAVDIVSMKELFIELKHQLSRRYSKGRLSFNPAPLLRTIDSFLVGT